MDLLAHGKEDLRGQQRYDILQVYFYEDKEVEQVESENEKGPSFPDVKDVKMYSERTIDVNQPRKAYAAFSSPAPALTLTTEVKFPEFRKNLPDPSISKISKICSIYNREDGFPSERPAYSTITSSIHSIFENTNHNEGEPFSRSSFYNMVTTK